MGSGTTLIMAYEMGCKAIGTDIVPEYVEMIRRGFESYLKRVLRAFLLTNITTANRLGDPTGPLYLLSEDE